MSSDLKATSQKMHRLYVVVTNLPYSKAFRGAITILHQYQPPSPSLFLELILWSVKEL